ncbi:OmpA family protein [Chryseobacterium sp. MFBS3-17]|uniref:OmpA family protein n=1 Tax=Chryseobacterium sp. MFBS3-17 TaxID=2886689 RepID=UPI001D0F1668|nr:OmpA family protein [Chryseobacterium sp. MFBS3-17]MCC2591083.1 OmpA family protein [Chryseobacterium sp. MFBS3-17]
MKLILLALVSLPIGMYAQDSIALAQTEYPNTYSSGSAYVQKFDNSARRFNDWSVSVGGGAAFLPHADLTSFYDGKVNWGWTAYAGLNKQITHTFGMGLQYQVGQTNQQGMLSGQEGVLAGVADAWTKFHQISLMGDVNFSNLLRRVDNHSPYRWAFHGYAGIGFQKYKTLLIDQNASRWNDHPPRVPIEIDQDFAVGSLFFQGGLGVKYKVSKLIDIEARTMYIITGDEEFDGGGWTREQAPIVNYNMLNDSFSDNMWTATLGLNFKLGNKLSHLAWHDPLQEAYGRINTLENIPVEFEVCESGDGDNDGVCDDWDRQLDTPAGARVDGAGVALDMDLDGVIDLYDKCVTVPGPVENDGCPTNQ